MNARVGVLFVCLGNICRSPTAEGVMRARAAARGLDDRLHIDSAGTGAWHVGRPPDPRTQEAARRRGYDLSALRARQVTRDDFLRFDMILAMDGDNLADLSAMAPSGSVVVPELVLRYATRTAQREVPDPYTGGMAGFEHVLDLLEDATDGLLDHLQQRWR